MSFKIEKAQTKDLNEILLLFKNTIENSCKNDYSNKQIKAWTASINNTKKWIGKIEHQYFIIVKKEEQIVGFGSLENDYLDLLFVHHQYLRKGIASLIYNELKSFSIKNGLDKLTVHASKTALQFFLSKNFSVIKENKIIINDVEIINFEMTQ